MGRCRSGRGRVKILGDNSQGQEHHPGRTRLRPAIHSRFSARVRKASAFAIGRVTRRQIGFGPYFGVDSGKGSSRPLSEHSFCQKSRPRVTVFRAFASKFGLVPAGEMSKVAASIVSLLLEMRPFGVFSEMAAGDTTVGSRPSHLASTSRKALISPCPQALLRQTLCQGRHGQR